MPRILGFVSKYKISPANNAAVMDDMHVVQEDEAGLSDSSDPEEMQHSTETDHPTIQEEPASSRDNSSDDEASGFGATFGEIQRIQKTQDSLKNLLESLKMNHQRDYMVILEVLEEDNIRYEALKQELADLTELHQREIWNLKEELISTKEKIHYTYHERAEFHEAMDACHSRLLKVELQQQHEVDMEGDEDAIPRTVLGKVISMLLAVLTAILVFVSMMSRFIILLKPSGRMLAALFLAAILHIIWKYREVIYKYKVYPAFETP